MTIINERQRVDFTEKTVSVRLKYREFSVGSKYGKDENNLFCK